MDLVETHAKVIQLTDMPAFPEELLEHISDREQDTISRPPSLPSTGTMQKPPHDQRILLFIHILRGVLSSLTHQFVLHVNDALNGEDRL